MTQKTKLGVLLMNLGSPDSTEVKDVSRYLNEFLLDGRVIDYPYIIRKPLVSGIIIPFRAPKSAEAYQSVWTEKGSPLIVISEALRDQLRQQLPYPVEITMRYGNPRPEEAFERLLKRMPDMEAVIAISLYPQYAMSSFETAVEHVKKAYKKNKYGFELNFLKPFYNEPAYIHAMTESMKPYLEQEYDHLLFSYHGVPARHIRKSDITGNHCLKTADCCSVSSPAHTFCYRHQCMEATRLLVQQLNIPEGKYSVSFQSRLGKGWLEPFTDVRLEQMPKEGIKKVLVICPAFVSDCLETLEEIAMRGKESFLAAGGESYEMIPCLNTNPLWVEALGGWVKEFVRQREEMPGAVNSMLLQKPADVLRGVVRR
jgi:ferrochelatase